MLPSKCEKCGNLIGHFYNMAKGDFSTMKEFLKMLDTKKVSEWSQVWLHKVCPKCKIALEKDGWKVIGNGMH